MLTFKLSRRGKKKQPTYRLVVVDKKKDPWGMIKEDVGSYNPHTKKAQFKIERIKFWISKGAQPSPTVHNILVKEKILDAAKKRIKIKKKSSVAKAMEDKVTSVVKASSSASSSSAKSADTADKKATEDKLEDKVTSSTKSADMESEGKKTTAETPAVAPIEMPKAEAPAKPKIPEITPAKPETSVA